MVFSAPWMPRAFHAAAAYDDKLWVMGGGHWGVNPVFFRDVWCSADGVNWEQRSSNATWPARIWAAAVSYNGLLWMMGGFTGKVRGGTNDIWYSTDGRNWYPYFSSPVWPARLAHSVLEFNDQLLVVAGSNGDYFNDVWALKLNKTSIISGTTIARALRWLYTSTAR